MKYYAAPMEGVTGAMFRRVFHRHFPGADKYMAPFLSPTQDRRLTPRDRREILPEHNRGIPLVPQILTRRGEDFLWCAGLLWDMGYGEVNLNLGCPSGTVVAKGKGAGLLGRLGELERLLDEIFSAPMGGPVSVKTRLGIVDPEEFWDILELLRRYPIHELTVHPRVRRDQYREPVRPEWFAPAVENSPFPVCYNGDMTRGADLEALARRYPGTAAAMLGRGLLADPALIRKAKGGAPAGREELRAFVDELLEEYTAAFGSRNNAMLRLKEVWGFLICLFDDRDRCRKRLLRARDAGEYERAVDEIFSTLPLRREAELPWSGTLDFWAKPAPQPPVAEIPR